MRTQRGIGLIEIMVALTIGLLLVLGLATIFGSISQTFKSRQGLGELQTNQRMSKMFLDSAVHNAGFYPSPLTNTAFTSFPASGPFAIGQSLTGTGAGAGTDSLSVRFVADGVSPNQGCSAAPVANHTYTDVFSVTNGFLVCTETDNTAASAAVSAKLVPGLTGMNVLYGVDTTGGGSSTQYLTATQVTAVSQWMSVKTVNTTLTFTNPLAGQPVQPATISLMLSIPFQIGL